MRKLSLWKLGFQQQSSFKNVLAEWIVTKSCIGMWHLQVVRKYGDVSLHFSTLF